MKPVNRRLRSSCFSYSPPSHAKVFPFRQSRRNSPGAFLKGIDYVGEVSRFEREFNDDLAVIAHAVATFHLPGNLKLSVHSGSDKFALYPVIHRALEEDKCGSAPENRRDDMARRGDRSRGCGG